MGNGFAKRFIFLITRWFILIIMPRPTLTRDRLLYVLSEEVPMSHREILEETGLSPSAVWNGARARRC